MPKYHGITSETIRKNILDAGQVRLNYVDESTTGTLLGATSGGSVFTIEQEIREMPYDGAAGPVKGGKRITRVIAKLEVNFIEISQQIINLAIPGSTTAETPVGVPTHEEIRRALEIALTDYEDSVAILAQVSGSDHPFVGIIHNVLADGNFEIGATDKEEAICKVIFVGHFDTSDLETEPWTVRMPLDITTTAGA